MSLYSSILTMLIMGLCCRGHSVKGMHTPALAVRWGDLVILATPCMHEDAKLRQLAHSLGPHIAGKVGSAAPAGRAGPAVRTAALTFSLCRLPSLGCELGSLLFALCKSVTVGVGRRACCLGAHCTCSMHSAGSGSRLGALRSTSCLLFSTCRC